MRCERSFKYGSIKGAKCGVAARESAGIPLRYFPVKTPRPRGDQAINPVSRWREHCSESFSTLRFKSENSFWITARGALLLFASCRDMARALCQPLKFEIPTYRARPDVYAQSKADSASSNCADPSQL